MIQRARIVVLVVEDEIVVRMDIADALTLAGFTVLEAGDADEAITILNENHDIRVLFTDIDMPGTMDGLKLAAAVREKWPPIKIIVTSGHRQLSTDILPAGGRFYAKPYQHDHIITAIRDLVF